MALAAKRIKRGVSFSEIEPARNCRLEMMDRLIGNARAAAAVYHDRRPAGGPSAPGRKGGVWRDRVAHNRRVLRTGAH